MMRRIALLGALAACSGDSETTGPVYSPALQLALHSVAADCTVQKLTGPIKKRYTCTGAFGNVLVEVGDGDRLEHVQVKLHPMFLIRAKVHFANSLTAFVQQVGIDALHAQIDKIALGERVVVPVDGIRVELSAAGSSPVSPELTVDLNY